MKQHTHFIHSFLWILLLLATSFVLAQADPPTEVSAEIKARYSTIIPDADIGAIEPAPIPGFYQLVYKNTVYYMKEDASYVFAGALYDVKKMSNLSEQRLRRERLEALEAMKDSLITYDHKGRYRGTAYVFTDIDCGYCRRFHANMQEMNELGIRVHYILTPLRGPQSVLKAIAVQCAKNQNYAMDIAKNGGSVPMQRCENNVEDNVIIAFNIGMNGTPAIVLESGELIPGYMEAFRLLERIEGRD